MIKLIGGDGSSEDNAIVIQNAENEKDGVDTEYELVAKYFGVEDGDWGIVDQSFIQNDITWKCYDILYIENREGKQYTIFFDMTDFFGK